MKTIKIDKDHILNKDVLKVQFSPNELPHPILFSKADVFFGNPSCNIAIGIAYNWKEDNPPEEVRNLVLKLSNYAAITGYWRTTNGAKYIFANICRNPNINTLVLLAFDKKDNGHLVIDAMRKFYTKGMDKDGIILDCDAPNPSFEQVPPEALERLKHQVDLCIIKRIKPDQYDRIEEVLKALIQEPRNAVSLESLKDLDPEFYSTINKPSLYDDGARFASPLIYDMTLPSLSQPTETKIFSTLGMTLQVSSLAEAMEKFPSMIFHQGDMLRDQRNILISELRSFTTTIEDPFASLPSSFSKKYLEQYTDEFLHGKKGGFAYTYHERVFSHDQPKQIISLLKEHPESRRGLVCLWDPKKDLSNASPPCMDMLWFCIRSERLECHVLFRSHHIATVTKSGKLIPGEGAFVPNVYAIASLQQQIAEELQVKRGPLTIVDFSAHCYINEMED